MQEMSVIDEYKSKVFKWVIIIITGSCTCAGAAYSLLKILGFYPTVPWPLLSAFLVLNIIWITVGLTLIRKSMLKGYLDKNIYKKGKIWIATVIIVQFNFILYMIPSRVFWGYSFFFLILTAFFIDCKMIALCGGGLAVSLALAWGLNGENLLPVRDRLFVPDMAVCIIGVVLSFFSIYLYSMFISKFLVNAKKDELERNNEKIKRVLDGVSQLMGKLSSSSQKVLQSAQMQSASTEELSSISETLRETSGQVLQHSNESKQHLNELQKSSEKIADKNKKSGEISQQLEGISISNEQALNNLVHISTSVVSSGEVALNEIRKLVNDTKEIGKTLQIINDIADSTNLLALNASIEAARAGEAGRGFAVVADQVGKLADDTQMSLKEVNKIIERVQNGTDSASEAMSESSQKLESQNEVLQKTVSDVKNMIQLIKTSADAIREVENLNSQQNILVGRTVDYNRSISEGITDEDNVFSNIVELVQSNTEEVSELNAQVDTLDGIVKEMKELLQS